MDLILNRSVKLINPLTRRTLFFGWVKLMHAVEEERLEEVSDVSCGTSSPGRVVVLLEDTATQAARDDPVTRGRIVASRAASLWVASFSFNL